jgi:hypothetical protein
VPARVEGEVPNVLDDKKNFLIESLGYILTSKKLEGYLFSYEKNILDENFSVPV